MRRLEQASQPLHSPRPQRVVDVDQLTEATSRMADHADEAESWRELRRSYEVSGSSPTLNSRLLIESHLLDRGGRGPSAGAAESARFTDHAGQGCALCRAQAEWKDSQRSVNC